MRHLTALGRSRVLRPLLVALALLLALPAGLLAHPLGNFTINHYTELKVASDRLVVRHIIDMAEIAAFVELQAADADTDGVASPTEVEAYAARIGDRLAEALVVTIDGRRVPLEVHTRTHSRPDGEGGLPTLRLEYQLEAGEVASGADLIGTVEFENRMFLERVGWREIAVVPEPGTRVFDSTAFANSASDALRRYPEDKMAAPLDERNASFSFTSGTLPDGATALVTRDGATAVAEGDPFSKLIAVRELTPGVALLGLLVAMLLGGMHAMSPGHGKTVVGAYLVGSRGTAKHAAFLGLTVTVTHTAAVFALGLVTLFASDRVLPERLYPLLSLGSGLIVVAIGLRLFSTRLREAVGLGHAHDHAHAGHGHSHGGHVHSHGGHAHSHLPPGADGQAITWGSLLSLGISGGMLPCPSALVVLLSAIALHRVGYGLLLILAFSIGLAGVLTLVGLAFVYARDRIPIPEDRSWILRVLPALSAIVITVAGAVIVYQALGQAGLAPAHLLERFTGEEPELIGLGAMSVLGLGLLFGFKHATEADHVVAVSTIVAESRSVRRAAVVGALWGTGHTASLILVGIMVLALRITISESVESWLEFGVAIMIIALGLGALWRVLRHRDDIHVHAHRHGDHEHTHVHFHDPATEHGAANEPHSHGVASIGLKPVLVGAVHGLAGSAALTLLILTQIESVPLGLLYLLVFGGGSIGGMLAMSGLIGLPFALSAARGRGFHRVLQLCAGVLSIGFGLWYAVHTFSA